MESKNPPMKPRYGWKRCRMCEEALPPELFAQIAGARKTVCRKCFQSTLRHGGEMHLTRRTKEHLLDELKQRPCADCGKYVHPHALEFDHRTDKHFSINEAMTLSVSLKALKAELAKCDTVCVNCHRIRTRARKRSKRK